MFVVDLRLIVGYCCGRTCYLVDFRFFVAGLQGVDVD